MRTSRLILPLFLLVVVTACASSGGAQRARSSSDTLNRADLEESMQVNAYEAIRQSRPMWLRVRGPNSFNSENPIMVYVDGVRAGGVETLQSLPVLAIERMKFYDPPEAQARFGLNHTNGAIEVVTRKGS